MPRASSALPFVFAILLLSLGQRARGEPPVTIEVGNLNAEDGDLWLRGEIESFRRAHPHIHVRLSTLGYPSRNEVRIEDLPDLALNVLGVISDQGYEIAYLVERDLIRPVEAFLPDPDVRLEDFIGNTLDAVTYRQKVWGIPYLAASVLFLIDRDLFRAEGLSNPPATWEEVLDYARRLTRDSDGDGRVDQWGFRLGMRGRYDTHMFYLWLTLALQREAEVLREGRFHLDHPALREAYDFLMTLQSSGGARTDNRRLRETLADQTVRYAMQIAPTYQIDPAAGTLHYQIIPWPTWGRRVIPDERRQYLVIGKSTPEKEAASWEFVKWMVRADAPHPSQARFFGISCRKDLVERPDIRAKIDRWARGFDVVHETKGWNVRHGEPVMGRFAALEHLETIVTKLFHSELSFEEAMRVAETECNAILRGAKGIAQPYALYLPDSGTSPGIVGDPSMEVLFTESADILQALPYHPGADALLNRTLELAPGKPRAEALMELASRFPDHPIGLFAFERAFVEAASGATRGNLCETVLRDTHGSSVSRLAWDFRLGLLSPEERMQSIRKGMEAEDQSLRRVALFRHAEDLRGDGDFEEAAVFYLRFWGDNPECVSRMGWERTILACLKNAGQTLDAEAMFELGDPAMVARILHTARGSNSFSDNAVASRLVEWCAGVRDGTVTESDWAALVSEPSGDMDVGKRLDLGLEAVYRAALMDLALRERSGPPSESPLRGAYRLESVSDREYGRRLALHAFQAGLRAARADPQWRPLAYRVFDCARRVLVQARESSLILACLEELVEKVPEERESPKALMELASLARENGEFERALGALTRVADLFPNSDEAGEALLLRGIWLLGAGRHSEAAETLARISAGAGAVDRALLELAILLCEGVPDAPNGVESRLVSFARKWSAHPLGARVRLLIAAISMDRMALSGAKQILQEVGSNGGIEPCRDRASQALKALNSSLSRP